MKTSRKNKRVVHLYLDNDLLDTYQRLYPHTLTAFVERIIKRVVNSEKEFDNLFFRSILEDVQ